MRNFTEIVESKLGSEVRTASKSPLRQTGKPVVIVKSDPTMSTRGLVVFTVVAHNHPSPAPTYPGLFSYRDFGPRMRRYRQDIRLMT